MTVLLVKRCLTSETQGERWMMTLESLGRMIVKKRGDQGIRAAAKEVGVTPESAQPLDEHNARRIGQRESTATDVAFMTNRSRDLEQKPVDVYLTYLERMVRKGRTNVHFAHHVIDLFSDDLTAEDLRYLFNHVRVLIGNNTEALRPIQAALDDGRIHAVQIKTYTPAQWCQSKQDDGLNIIS